MSAEDLDNTFEVIYRKYFVRLQNALTLKRGVVDPLIKSWREMGVNVDSLFNPAQDSSEKEQIEFFRKRFLPASKAAMEIVGRETRRFEIDLLLNNYQNYLESFGQLLLEWIYGLLSANEAKSIKMHMKILRDLMK